MRVAVASRSRSPGREGVRRPELLALLLLASQEAGCDLGEAQLEPVGPRLHVLQSSPQNGEGIACGGGDVVCGVPTNRAIRLQVDRPVLPFSVTRQAIALYSGSPGVGSPLLLPGYDVLDRTVSYQLGAWLEPRSLYRIELEVAAEPWQPGLRAFDGAPLTDGVVPTKLSFYTSAVATTPEPPLPFEPTCNDVVSILSAHCASSCCHGAERPALGLRLDSISGLSATAIGRVAHQTETGDTVGVSLASPARFGVAMPIIDPGSAATSYLVYKLLLEAQNLAPCASGSCDYEALAQARGCDPLSDAERERLAGWFVQGAPMPPSRYGISEACLPSAGVLDCGATRAIARFIDTGALCR